MIRSAIGARRSCPHRHGKGARRSCPHWRPQNDYEESGRAFRAALRLEPDNNLTKRRLGATLLDDGKAEEAAGLLSEVVESDPGFAQGRYDLARALEGLGRYEEAIGLLKKLTAEHPRYRVAFFTLAQAYRKAGNPVEAKRVLETHNKIVDEAPPLEDRRIAEMRGYNLGVRPLKRSAKSLLEKGRYRRAVGMYKRALELEPNSPNLHLNLLASMNLARYFEESEEHFEVARQSSVTEGLAYYHFGNTRFLQERYSEAEPLVRQACELKPRLAEARVFWATFWRRRGGMARRRRAIGRRWRWTHG